MSWERTGPPEGRARHVAYVDAASQPELAAYLWRLPLGSKSDKMVQLMAAGLEALGLKGEGLPSDTTRPAARGHRSASTAAALGAGSPAGGATRPTADVAAVASAPPNAEPGLSSGGARFLAQFGA